MTERSANDTTTPARLVLDAYIIDPVTKLPMAPGVASGGASEAKQDEQTAALGAPDDAAWDYGASGSLNAISKAQANALAALLAAIGSPDDLPWDGTGDPTSLFAMLKYQSNGDPVVVASGPPTSTTVTIADSASLSGAAQVDGKLVGLVTPAGWTTANITFQGSADGTNYFNIYDGTTERAVGSTAASTFVSLDISDWVGVNYVKVRSGTSGAATNQSGSDVITLILAG